MLKINTLLIIMVSIVSFSCKKDKIIPEPIFVIKKWVKSIEKLDYKKYSKCEAYPKTKSVFREIYKEDYFVDLMVIEVSEPDEEDIRKDFKKNSYIYRSLQFEGTVVKRSTKRPYQIVRGDIAFIKFMDGKRSNDGWLISNRTITRVNKK